MKKEKVKHTGYDLDYNPVYSAPEGISLYEVLKQTEIKFKKHIGVIE